MAVKPHGAIVAIGRGAYTVSWLGIGTTSADDTGSGLVVPAGYNDIVIQVKGTFAGSTVTIEGSNDGGTTWAAVNDSRGETNTMAFAAADIRKLNENPQLLRPVLTSGSSSNLDVAVVVRRS